jgi:DAACS family dicarboxylate/amino acid:cation (Na+ or H+) symporter
MLTSSFRTPTGQVLLAVATGVGFGLFLHSPEGQGFVDPVTSGQIGLVIIRFLKALALPLIFFAVTEAIVRTDFAGRSGSRFLIISLINVSIACLIGLSLINLFHPGSSWQGHIEALLSAIGSPSKTPLLAPEKTRLDWVQGLSALFPQHVLEPLQSGNVLGVVVLAAFIGGALRGLKSSSRDDELKAVELMITMISGGYLVFSRVLGYAIRLAPIAVFTLVTQAVAKLGLGVFLDLADYLWIILAGLFAQGFLYYPLASRFAGKHSPWRFLKGASEAAWTGFALNSSLAAVPVTLKCLKRMRVDEQSARVSVCGGSNFNNDGVVLYEVVTALFLAEAMGMGLDLPQQIQVALSSIIASAGIAGVPEAGLIILPIVLGNSGFSEAAIAAAIPLVAPLDWVLARCRSGINVLSDILGAVLLARWNRR